VGEDINKIHLAHPCEKACSLVNFCRQIEKFARSSQFIEFSIALGDHFNVTYGKTLFITLTKNDISG